MRVSTQQFYYQSSNQITQKTSEINQQSINLSSGKRVLSAKDDAINYGTMTGYKNELTKIEQYQRNITQAKNRNTLSETSLSLAQDTLLKIKQIAVQGNNGALSDTDRASLADQIQLHFNELLDIANTKDETGGYIFSGFQTDKQPFVKLNDNSVIYQGDSGVKKLSISNTVDVSLNQPGDEVFDSVPNVIGDFLPTYTTNNGNVSVAKAAIVDRGTYNTSTYPPGYTLNFTDADNNGSLEVVVTDATNSAVTTIDPFVEGQPFNFNGVEVTLDGKPAVGDSITLDPKEKISIFNVLKNTIDWLNTDTSSVDDKQHQIDYGHMLSQLNEGISYLSTRQAQSGININLIDRQESNHLDTQLFLEQGRSSIEDLDFATAVSQFEQTKVALQAAQSTFSQIQQLSLFNYI